MVNSKYVVLLSTISLLAVSGCSGGQRLRQMFAPEREFMALSELDEADGTDDTQIADSGSRRKLTDLLASRSKSSDEETRQEEDKIVRTGFLRRLLKSKETEGMPEDPFLDDQGSKEQPPVMTAGNSRKLDGDDSRSTKDRTTAAEKADDRDSLLADLGRETTRRTTKPNTNSKRKSGKTDKDPSLSDLIADFRNDEKNFPPADRSRSDSDPRDDTDNTIARDAEADFNAFLKTASRSGSDAADVVSDEEDVQLDVALLDKLTSAESVDDKDDSGFPLPEGLEDDRYDNDQAEALIQESADSSDDAFDALVNSDGADTPPSSQETGNSQNGLWGSSGDSFSWQDRNVIADETAFDDDSLWNAFPEVPVSSASRSTDDSGSVFRTADMSRTDGEQSDVRVTATAHGKPSSGSAAGPFESDPFLADFESQASTGSTATESPVAAPPTLSSAGLGGIAPRTWLILLAVVVALYLLIAPERRNPTHPTNR